MSYEDEPTNALDFMTGCEVLAAYHVLKEAIALQTSGGVFLAEAEGECWIEHVSGVSALVGATVVKCNAVDMPPVADDEQDQDYGFEIHTTKGVFRIEYRNDSNGYYGGSLEWEGPMSIQKGARVCRRMKPLTKDF